jgi:isocitrate/isopropylmalate dehydrogenase
MYSLIVEDGIIIQLPKLELTTVGMFGVLEQLDLRKMLSSYQRLKFKKDLAQKVAEELKEDIEFIIMRPNTARAKNIRMEVKERQNG